jgi:hypothetical protein
MEVEAARIKFGPHANTGILIAAPYQQPAAMMIYSAAMRDVFARAKFEADAPSKTAVGRMRGPVGI